MEHRLNRLDEPVSWQCQSLCGLTLAFNIDWRVLKSFAKPKGTESKLLPCRNSQSRPRSHVWGGVDVWGCSRPPPRRGTSPQGWRSPSLASSLTDRDRFWVFKVWDFFNPPICFFRMASLCDMKRGLLFVTRQRHLWREFSKMQKQVATVRRSEKPSVREREFFGSEVWRPFLN